MFKGTVRLSRIDRFIKFDRIGSMAASCGSPLRCIQQRCACGGRVPSGANRYQDPGDSFLHDLPRISNGRARGDVKNIEHRGRFVVASHHRIPDGNPIWKLICSEDAAVM